MIPPVHELPHLLEKGIESGFLGKLRSLKSDGRPAITGSVTRRATNRPFSPSSFGIHPSNFASLAGQLFYSTQIPVCLWFSGENNTLDLANDARLFGGETELS